MKKIVSVLLLMVIMSGIFPSKTMAANPVVAVDTETIFLKDFGMMDVTTVTAINSVMGNKTCVANVTRTYSANGIDIATVTLSVTFGFNGSSVWVISKSVTKNVSSGWAYSGQQISISGGTVTLTAQLSHRDISTFVQVPVEITITCTPTGQIS